MDLNALGLILGHYRLIKCIKHFLSIAHMSAMKDEIILIIVAARFRVK